MYFAAGVRAVFDVFFLVHLYAEKMISVSILRSGIQPNNVCNIDPNYILIVNYEINLSIILLLHVQLTFISIPTYSLYIMMLNADERKIR